MSVATEAPSEEVFVGANSAAPLQIQWRFIDGDDLVVTAIVAGVEVPEPLVRGIDYEVAGGGTGGGTVTPLYARAAGTSWRVRRETPKGQPAQLPTGNYNPKQIEQALDRQGLAVQEHDRELERSVKVPRGESSYILPPAFERIGRFISHDALGRAIMSHGTGADEGLRLDLGDEEIGPDIVALPGGRTLGEQIADKVNVKNKGATGLGLVEETAAFVAAVAALPNGGVVEVPDGIYRIGTVPIATRNIHVELSPGAVLLGVEFVGFNRAIFQIDGLHNAGFRLTGGRVDLNGEGLREIGVAGRIANTYAHKTVEAITTISGPVRAAVYAVRSTNVTVEQTVIENSGEDGLLFRNCGNIAVRRCGFRNIANWAIEFSFTPDGADGSTSEMPASFDNWTFDDLWFEDIDDLGIGTGNGGCIGGGTSGPEPLGNIANWKFLNFRARRCWRVLQWEAPFGGTTLDNVELRGFDVDDIAQTVVTMVGVRSIKYDKITGDRIGDATATALYYPQVGGDSDEDYIDVSALIISGDCADAKLDKVDIRDTRTGGTVTRADAVISALELDVLTSAGTAFDDDDVGKPIGILGAGPSGVNDDGAFTTVHRTYIAEVLTATKVRLEHAAHTAVAGAHFAFGGHLRAGLSIKGNMPRLEDNTLTGEGGKVFSISNSTITAGATGGLPNEPGGGAIIAKPVRTALRVDTTTLTAPANGVPVADAIVTADGADAFTGTVAIADTVKFAGFANRYAGKFRPRPTGIAPHKSFPQDRNLAPAAGANAYGDEEVLYTDSSSFIDLLRASFATAGGAFAGGETVTFAFQLLEHDDEAAFPLVELPLAAAGKVVADAGDLLRANPTVRSFKGVRIKMKSSAAGSAVTGKANATARQT